MRTLLVMSVGILAIQSGCNRDSSPDAVASTKTGASSAAAGGASGTSTNSSGSSSTSSSGGANSASGGAGGQAPNGATLTVSPPSATVMASGTQTFACLVTGLSDVGCTWSIEEGASGGGISAAGVYTAPSASGVYHVVAASHAMPALTAAATVIVPAAVGDCTSLGAVGVVEDITPADFHDPSNLETFAVAVNPQQPNIVFAAAGNITNSACPSGTCPKKGTGIYVSKDCGKTFTPLSTGPSGAFSSGDNWNIRVDPINPNVMYTMNGYGSPPSLFKSTDAGATWTNLLTAKEFTTPDKGGLFTYGGFVRSFDIEAADTSHLVVAFHEDCFGAVAASATDAVNGAVMCLAESRDAGDTWSFFEGPIVAASADGGGPVILSKNSLVYANPGDQNGNTAWFTSDSQRAKSSWKAVLTYSQSGPFNAVNSSGASFDPGGTLYLPGGSSLVYSSPGATSGQTWTVVPGSPGSMVLIGDGRAADQGGMLFVSSRVPGLELSISSAPLSDLTKFTPLKTPPGFNGVSGMAYDVVHHVLYGGAGIQGLYRVVTY